MRAADANPIDTATGVTAPPYGRREARSSATASPAYAGPTYYERSAVKRPTYRWLVAGYVFVGGLAGAAQVLATAGDLGGAPRSVVRAGRYVALAGAVAGPALLVADLHVPSRWYNMLRIFRPTSPMSLGSWTLASFGALGAATAGAQAMSDRGSRRARTLARILGVPAAALGTVMSVYTGVLLSTTSVPLWAAAPRVLPPLFGASAMASAVAAVTLATARRQGASDALTRLGAATAAVELALSLALRRALVRRHVGHDLLHGGLAWVHDIASVGAGIVAPLALHGMVLVTRRRSRLASLAAATVALVGGFMLRLTLVLGGRRSAERPREYFALTGNAR